MYERINSLVIRGKQGDKQALNELVNTYEKLVRKYSRNYFVKGYDEEDLQQIARLAIVEAANKFDVTNGANFTGFVEIFLRNIFVMMIRKKENSIVCPSLDSVNEEGIELKEMVADDFNLEECIIENADKKKLREAMRILPKEEQEILLATFHGRGGLKEYSKRKGISYATARYRKNKALDILRRKMKIKR